MKHWIDNADSYVCPVCGFETNNPNRYAGAKCPYCGFQADVDKNAFKNTEQITPKFFELKMRDSHSLTMLVGALSVNGYKCSTSVVWKEFPENGIDYFMVRIEEDNSNKC